MAGAISTAWPASCTRCSPARPLHRPHRGRDHPAAPDRRIRRRSPTCVPPCRRRWSTRCSAPSASRRPIDSTRWPSSPARFSRASRTDVSVASAGAATASSPPESPVLALVALASCSDREAPATVRSPSSAKTTQVTRDPALEGRSRELARRAGPRLRCRPHHRDPVLRASGLRAPVDRGPDQRHHDDFRRRARGPMAPIRLPGRRRLFCRPLPLVAERVAVAARHALRWHRQRMGAARPGFDSSPDRSRISSSRG